MAREEETNKSPEELRARIWELAKSIRYCMFVTWDGEKQTARAMDATVEEADGAIYFLTDKAGSKVAQVRNFPVVTVTFSDVRSFKFVTLSGTAEVTNDRAKIKDIWTASSKAWWDSADDPDIRLVTFRPNEAELWDSPNLLISSVLMLSAAVTGAKPKIGDHAKVSI
jgi:general stress protein 26